MNEIAEYIEHNVDEVREDIVKMVAGIPVEVELEGYAASQLQLDSRDESYLPWWSLDLIIS